MEVLHITPVTNGYEEVTLIANRVNMTNSLSVIKKDNTIFMTGGFILTNTPQIRAALDTIPREEQYQFVKDFKTDPFVKFYYED
jgi:hypothetical protein